MEIRFIKNKQKSEKQLSIRQREVGRFKEIGRQVGRKVVGIGGRVRDD